MTNGLSGIGGRERQQAFNNIALYGWHTHIDIYIYIYSRLDVVSNITLYTLYFIHTMLYEGAIFPFFCGYSIQFISLFKDGQKKTFRNRHTDITT